jgi:hypothetical protein
MYVDSKGPKVSILERINNRFYAEKADEFFL